MDSGHNIKKLDIVYCLKEGSKSEELKYSLRSLSNFPHAKVWLYGGCPDWINKDKVNWVHINQNCGNKWSNTSLLLTEIAKNDNISEDFVWFNDDFFILKPIDHLGYYYDRTLSQRAQDFFRKQVSNGNYVRRLRIAERELKWSHQTTNNFELHIPMIFNRKKLLQIINTYPKIGAKRSLYGNCIVKDAKLMKDVKIYDITSLPEDSWTFLSTSDLSFINGEVGKWIRKKFKTKSEYERSANGARQSKPKGGNNPRRNRGKKSGISEEMEKPSNVGEPEVQEVLHDETKE